LVLYRKPDRTVFRLLRAIVELVLRALYRALLEWPRHCRLGFLHGELRLLLLLLPGGQLGLHRSRLFRALPGPTQGGAPAGNKNLVDDEDMKHI